MNFRRIGATTLVTAIAIISAFTYANEDQKRKEQEATIRMSVANAASAYNGRYRNARAIAVEGPESVKERNRAWFQSMQKWLEGWGQIQALADLNEQLTYDEFQTKLTELLSAQSRTLVHLQEEAHEIRALADKGLATLSDETLPIGPETLAYHETIKALVARQSELSSMLQSTGSLPEAKLGTLQGLHNDSRRAIVSRMKRALVDRARYPLQQAMSDVNTLLSAEKVVGPALVRIGTAFTNIRRHSLRSAYFHMQDAIGPAKHECSTARSALAQMPSTHRYVRDSKGKLDNLCSQLDTLYNGFMADATNSHAKLVEAYVNRNRVAYNRICGNTSQSPACEKLGLMINVSQNQLSKMTDSELRSLELTLGDALERAGSK